MKKELTAFLPEKRRKDGYTNVCKDCTNERRRQRKLLHKQSTKTVEKKSHHVPIQQDNIFQRIAEAHNSCYCITVQKNGSLRLHVMSNPAHVFKGSVHDIEKILESAAQ